MATKSKRNAPKMGVGTQKAPSSYELMGIRIMKEINSPAAQAKCIATVTKQPHESWEDWDQFVEEIQTNEEVTLTELEEGKIRLEWEKFVPEKD